MVRTGSIGRTTVFGSSSSDKPFLKLLMPLATSPMTSEILFFPPKKRRRTAPRMIQ